MDLSLDLEKIFSQTLSALGAEDAAKVRADFEQEWGVRNLHFFPMVLREKKYSLAVVEIADYEFQIHFLRTQDFGVRPSGSANLIVHASCQFIRISAASVILKKNAGLYVIWKIANEIREKRLEMSEAALLDRLREDLPVYRKSLSDDEYQTLLNLMKLGIINENVPTSLSPT
jgi:hypothetical protein